MKHTVLLFVAWGAFSVPPGMAQIPNGGFENWSTVPGGYEDLDEWITFNSATSPLGILPSCMKESPGAVGNYYATVTTRSSPFGVLAGIISVGNLSAGTTGFPYTGRPAAMTGQWQYGMQAGDSGLVVVVFSKWNSSTQSQESIGGGSLVVSGASPTAWQPLSVPVVYSSLDTPDSAYVIIASSGGGPVEGSFIKLDDLGFDGSASVGEQPRVSDLDIFPSPAKDVLHVGSLRPIAELQLVATDGRTLLHRAVNAVQVDLALDHLNAGRYLLLVRWSDGMRTVRTFMKQ